MVTMAVDVERLREVCERYGVMRLEVFGSVARGTVAAGSDVDLLYTLAPDAHLGWAIEDLSAELSALLGKPVDLVSRGALNSRIRDEVLAEAQPFYAAADRPPREPSSSTRSQPTNSSTGTPTR